MTPIVSDVPDLSPGPPGVTVGCSSGCGVLRSSWAQAVGRPGMCPPGGFFTPAHCSTKGGQVGLKSALGAPSAVSRWVVVGGAVSDGVRSHTG